MLKDIKETPTALRTLLKNTDIDLKTRNISKLYIAGSGSSRNAAIAAKYFIEKTTGIPVIIDFAGEFAHRSVVFSQDDLFVALSQSGETADVLAALKKARLSNIQTLAVTNNENSTIHRTADSSMLLYAGFERSIPATKTFTCQMMALYLLGLYISDKNEERLSLIPDKIAELLDNEDKTLAIAKQIKNFSNLVILGRGQNWALAAEAALKIRETCYINASGHPAGEFLHGHLAILDSNFPVISILTRCFDDRENYPLAKKNTDEIKRKRNPVLISIDDSGDDEVIAPFLTAVTLQLLAYNTAKLLGRDTDRPRSLEKAVISE